MTTADDLHQLMASRRSIRRFRPDRPDDGQIRRLLEAAVTAPSASNKQPWRFVVITSRSVIETMAEAVREVVDRIADQLEPAWVDSFRSYGDYFTRFESAPVVIAVLHRSLRILSHMAPGLETVPPMEEKSGLIGASLATQNLLLMAHALELGASGMTGPLVARDRLRQILEIPGSWELAAFVAVGIPAEDPPPTARKPVDKVTRWIE